jgi:hypothetical protein
MNRLPMLIIHADWSNHPAKRWMSRASLNGDGSYSAEPPQPVPPLQEFLAGLEKQAKAGSNILLGFDFPIGLPLTYARLAGITDFAKVLPQFGSGAWISFYQVAESPDQIGLYRPFYPQRPGHTNQANLLKALQLQNINQLRRKCELPHPGRRAAAPLFWTLGGQQVGKAAICGWRDFLAPALQSLDGIPLLWPFAGDLFTLLKPGSVVVAETYPAEYYRHLKISFSPHRRGRRSGKRSSVDRKLNAEQLLKVSTDLELGIADDLETIILAGFGNAAASEDAFDSFIGLLGILSVLRGKLPEPSSLPDEIRAIEGWILGQGV